ncbi:hypothetical protein ACIHBQ_06960 [Streptomyces sp. NPDC052492]|uniref:hypothetical protein n=1 Tax=Streptomyces sp. NPDC052492 TaxID=3365691 RepID=UPI0037D32303
MTGRTDSGREGRSMPSREQPHQGAPLADVVTRFEAYARARAARDSLLPAARTGPRQEEHAFAALQAAVTRLRDSLR